MVLKRKKGLQVGKGKNIWHQIHVHDLSDLYLAIGEAAAAGGGKATWDNEGYYFAENGPFVWGDIQRTVSKAAFDKGLIPSPEPDILDWKQTAAEFAPGPGSWGTNSRGHAIRGRKLFGWDPHRPDAVALIPDIVGVEAEALGLI